MMRGRVNRLRRTLDAYARKIMRKSNEAQDYPISNPMKYEEYMRKKQQETELLKTVPPALKPYYKEKVNSYFIKLGDQ